MVFLFCPGYPPTYLKDQYSVFCRGSPLVLHLPEGPVEVEHMHVARHAVAQHVPWDGLAVEPEGRRRRSGRRVASTGQTEDIKPQRGCSITADQQFPHRYDDPCPNLL